MNFVVNCVFGARMWEMALHGGFGSAVSRGSAEAVRRQCDGCGEHGDAANTSDIRGCGSRILCAECRDNEAADAGWSGEAVAMATELPIELAAQMQNTALASPLKRPHSSLGGEEDDLEFVGERTREQRDEEGRANAVDLEVLPVLATDEHATHPIKLETFVPAGLPPPPPPPPQRHPPIPPLAHPLPQLSLPRPPSLLDADQQRALDIALAGHHLFLTGGAGVGKSFTLRTIIKHLVQRYGERSVAVTATTGCASVHIDGQTLHSLAGIGVPIHASDFGRMWSAGGQKVQKWRELRVLVIDEVSMLDAEYFDHLSIAVDRAVNYAEIGEEMADADAEVIETEVKAAVKTEVKTEVKAEVKGEVKGEPRRAKLFGGHVQLIVCGDFLQLAPVRRTFGQNLACKQGDRLPTLRDPPKAGPRGRAPWRAYRTVETHGQCAFKAVAWQEAGLSVVELRTVHRQRERALLDALNDVRAGLGETRAVRALTSVTCRPLDSSHGEPIHLFCTNELCDDLNEARLEPLVRSATNESDVFVAADYVKVDAMTVKEEVEAGRDEGEVVSELEEELWAAFFDDKEVARVQTFAVGAQVLLSANEQPGGFVNGDLGEVVAFRHATEEELALYEAEERPLLAGEAARKYPLVRFRRSLQSGTNERLIVPHNKTRRLYRVGDCIRRRLPLQLAWAITVHKSQGMSLPKLQVELGNAFAAGQSYVALSRATDLDGLCIRSFSPESVKRLISHDALRFHEAVTKASDATAAAASGSSAHSGNARTSNAQPLADYYAAVHYWWKDVLEGPATHTGWASVFRGEAKRGTSFATEFRRWEKAYPVPGRLRKLSVS